MREPRPTWTRVVGIVLAVAAAAVVAMFIVWAAFMLTAPRL